MVLNSYTADMYKPTVDIVVPVWNSPFETRACLAAIIACSPEARLIVVDNGSSRETELMLEEFSEPIGERGLFIKTERNVGLVPAINMGLARSDSDFAVIVRPQVMVHDGWLKTLLDTAETTGAGILSPLFTGGGAPALPPLAPGCTVMETCSVSFTALLLRREMLIMIGAFDARLDGGEWCLKEYVRRASAGGYTTSMTSRCILKCDAESLFGSAERRFEMQQNSCLAYLAVWGESRHYVVYFGKECDTADLSSAVDVILNAARQGHRFTLLLHRRQHSDFRRKGWNALHTGIELYCLSMLFTERDLTRKINSLLGSSPDLLAVRGTPPLQFPLIDTAISMEELILATSPDTGRLTGQTTEASA